MTLMQQLLTKIAPSETDISNRRSVAEIAAHLPERTFLRLLTELAPRALRYLRQWNNDSATVILHIYDRRGQLRDYGRVSSATRSS